MIRVETRPRVLAAGVISCLLMLFVTAAPALAQDASDDDIIDDDSVTDVQYGDNTNIETGDITSSVCAPVVNQYNNVVQVTGDANAASGANASGEGSTATSGDAVATTAAALGVTQSVVINCVQDGSGDVPDTPDNGDTPTPPDDDDTTPPDDDDTNNPGDGGGDNTQQQETTNTRSGTVLTDTIPAKVLANTGGISPLALNSSVLLPVGALLVVSGITTAFWFGKRRG